MPTFTDIRIWPPTGWPDRLWGHTLDEDMFARTARRVCERYSEALSGAGLDGLRREIRISAWSASEPTVEHVVPIEVFTGSQGDAASLHLPPDVAALARQERGLLVLDVVDAVMRQLAPHRGWSTAVLDDLRSHVEVHQLRWTWASPGKKSPGRRYTARAVFDLLDDGYGSVVLEIRSASDDMLLSRSGPHLAFSTQNGFLRSAASIRWIAKDAVAFHPSIGIQNDKSEPVALCVDDPPSDSTSVRRELWPRLPQIGARRGGPPQYVEPEEVPMRRPAVRAEYLGRV